MVNSMYTYPQLQTYSNILLEKKHSLLYSRSLRMYIGIGQVVDKKTAFQHLRYLLNSSRFPVGELNPGPPRDRLAY